MNSKSHFLLTCLFIISITFAGAQVFDDSNTLAPYFFIEGKSNKQELLPVKAIAAKVEIAGVIAQVNLSQTYVNNGKMPIEAVYVFPTSTRAAVNGVTMKIGTRTIVAQIQEKGKAKENYNQAKSEGFRASLLEQHRPNVFQMNVANIMPGDTIIVDIKYNEFIASNNGTYEFVFPTVVGPRYSERSEATANRRHQWVSNPYLQEGDSPNYSFELEVMLNSPVPIQSVRTPTHDTDIKFLSTKACTISISPTENAGTKDFTLHYSLVGNEMQSGILINKGAKENFFALMVQPPAQVQAFEKPNREYTFVVDVSGSMSGFPLQTAKDLMYDLLKTLTERDRFNVVLFASQSNKLFRNSMPATNENIKEAIRLLSRNGGGGGTRLYSALSDVMMSHCESKFSRTIVVITDGYIDAEKEVFDLISDNLGNANVFSFGVGTSVNRYLIEGMAKTGNGVPFVVENTVAAGDKVDEFIKYVGSPVLTNVGLNFGTNEVYDVTPQNLPDIFKDRSMLVYGKFKGEFTGDVTLTGEYGEGAYSMVISPDNMGSNNTGALPYLWVRNRVEELEEEKLKSQNIKMITELGLNYSLMTSYTSFLAIDSESTNQKKEILTVHQPLPLPSGVSNQAVGTYRQRMNATGAVSRGTSGAIRVFASGESPQVFNSIVALRWNGVNPNAEYDVVIKNIFDKEIYRQKISGTSCWIDLSLPGFANDAQGLFIVEVSDGPTNSSAPIGIRMVKNGYLPLLELEIVQPWEYYVELARKYEDSGFLLDALTAYEIAIYNYPENQQLIAYYGNFLVSNGLDY
jgi:Ca-activated chloride channel family protein